MTQNTGKRELKRQPFHVWYGLRRYRQFISWINYDSEEGWKSSACLALFLGVPFAISFIFFFVARYTGWDLSGSDEEGGTAGPIGTAICVVYWGLLYCTYKAVESTTLMPKPIREFYNALEEAEELLKINSIEHYSYSSSFANVRRRIEADLMRRPEDYIESAQETCPLQVVLAQIVNVSGDLADSGHFHLYRGIAGPEGKEYVRIHDEAVILLCEKGFMSRTEMTDLKKGLRESMKSVG